LDAVKAQLVIRDRRVFEDGCFVEVVVWRVPLPVLPAEHSLKYRLFYGRPGERIVGYDNERGKGDHRHYGNREEPYAFSTLAKLLDDFEADVVAARGDKI
jgi:hypothetical protein